MDELILLPQPRNITYQSGRFFLSHKQTIYCQGNLTSLFPIAQQLQSRLEALRHIKLELKARSKEHKLEEGVVIQMKAELPIAEQGYHLNITSQKIEILASTAIGAFYGMMTLLQMTHQNQGKFQACRIEDFPDFPTRGVMLDVSRDKVPTLKTIIALVDQLAEWKINHLELYMEHTFAYENHPEVWAQASPFTGEEILRLDAHCQERFIELVPNQNSFGHFHHWLDIPRYHHLAECPDGFDWPWGGRSERPFSLDPTNPQSFALLEDLYTELLPHFSSQKFNTGLDETVDLGQGKSKAICAAKGKGRVYLEVLLKVYELVKKQGRTMHFWGDIILQYPELVAELPKDVVVLEWGYEAAHPFEAHGELFAQSGIPFYVCPGTSSWSSISGRSKNCLDNLRNAAANGQKNGATGFLITDWGDKGHWQYLPFSYLGFSAGAALSWCYATNHLKSFMPELDLHVFQDSSEVMGHLAHELGNVYLQVGYVPQNASAIFHLLYRSWSQTIPETITTATLHETMESIHTIIAPLKTARMQRTDAPLILDEFLNAAQFLLHGCARGLAIKLGKQEDSDTRKELARSMTLLLGEHRRLWRMRNREGGLPDSTRLLETRLYEYTGREAPTERVF